MTTRSLVIFVLLLLVTGAIIAMPLLSGRGGGVGASGRPGHERVTIGDRTFEMKIADTPDARSRGLGGVAEIPEDGGMLFVFRHPEVQSFWMKDCLVDIDIVYLDPTGHVTALYEMPAQPLRQPDEPEPTSPTQRDRYHDRLRASGSYSSIFPACFVLEFRAGTLEQLGLEVGDKVELDYARLRDAATPEPLF